MQQQEEKTNIFPIGVYTCWEKKKMYIQEKPELKKKGSRKSRLI